MLAIGRHRLRNRVSLAPMAGVTDVPFRQLVWRLGVGYMVGEMTGSRPELARTRKTLLRREAVAGALHAVQIAGAETQWIATATRNAIEHGATIVDINFGCPAKKVCKKAAGSALMEQPEQLLALARAAVESARACGSGAEVTVKMRTGPNPENRNATELACQLQDVGVAGLAIHGRTRACKFRGVAEYDTIARIKSRVQIPVLANGDIRTPEDARRVLEQTDTDGVMVGRAALGAPWLPSWIAAGLSNATYRLPDLEQRLSWLQEQVLATHVFYGAEQGVRIARKHIQWTLTHPSLQQLENMELGDLAALSHALVRAKCTNAQLDLLSQAYERCAAQNF